MQDENGGLEKSPCEEPVEGELREAGPPFGSMDPKKQISPSQQEESLTENVPSETDAKYWCLDQIESSWLKLYTLNTGT